MNLLLDLSARTGSPKKDSEFPATRLPDAGWQVTCDNGAVFSRTAAGQPPPGENLGHRSNGRMWDVLSRDLDVEVIFGRCWHRWRFARIPTAPWPDCPLKLRNFHYRSRQNAERGRPPLTHRDFLRPAALNICGAAEPGIHSTSTTCIPEPRGSYRIPRFSAGRSGNPELAMASPLPKLCPRRFCQEHTSWSLGNLSTRKMF